MCSSVVVHDGSVEGIKVSNRLIYYRPKANQLQTDYCSLAARREHAFESIRADVAL